MSDPQAPSTQPLLVACLCAQWCGTCKDYVPLFEGLQSEFPDADFRWIDIEDEAEVVDPIEVENFPTILIVSGGQARFFGPVMPHLETVRRLIQSQQTQTGPSRLPAEVQALAGRVMALRP
ncbi:thioredoxin family protein [Rhodoferax lacus]|nr:thioredoxin family protein [Rhodoferax lacus]